MTQSGKMGRQGAWTSAGEVCMEGVAWCVVRGVGESYALVRFGTLWHAWRVGGVGGEEWCEAPNPQASAFAEGACCPNSKND